MFNTDHISKNDNFQSRWVSPVIWFNIPVLLNQVSHTAGVFGASDLGFCLSIWNINRYTEYWTFDKVVYDLWPWLIWGHFDGSIEWFCSSHKCLTFALIVRTTNDFFQTFHKGCFPWVSQSTIKLRFDVPNMPHYLIPLCL